MPAELPSARKIDSTVLFADLAGFTAIAGAVGAERAYGIVTGCLAALAEIARRHGAVVDLAQGDSLMAVFGHPVAIPDSGLAACHAAAEMRHRARRMVLEIPDAQPIALRVGINTGPMVAGTIRGPVVREFHVLGDTVNVAARLRARAPAGAIYVGARTRAEAGAGFDFDPLPLLRMKGKLERVEAHALGDPGPATCLHGLGTAPLPAKARLRGAEFARLRARARAAMDGRGSLVTVAGSEGSGRRELLAEVVRDTDLQVMRISSLSARREEPLCLFWGLAREFGCALRPEAIEAALAASVREKPLMLVFDSLEGADLGSLGLVQRLAQRAPTLPIVLVLLGAQGNLALGQIAGAVGRHVEHLHLAPLSEEEAGRLVDTVAEESGTSLTPELRARILTRGAGLVGRLLLATHLGHAIDEEASVRPEASVGGAERARATIVYADLSGFTALTEQLGPERAYPVIATCLRILDETARRHGGAVHKYLGDCVMALFGVPEAIEDAPRAALNAAIEMRRRIRAYALEQDVPLPLDVHTGVHTGPSIAGDVSGSMLREFAVMGDPVVVAAALTEAAPAGAILVGPETRRATAERFEYEREEDLRIEAIAEPVPCHRLCSERERLFRARLGVERPFFSQLVGRDREQRVLAGRIERLCAGEGGFVSLIGEAGLGKSRLLAELARETGDRVVWLEARSVAAGGRAGYQSFSDLLHGWAGIEEGDDEARANQKLEGLIGRFAPESVAEFLPVLARLAGCSHRAPSTPQGPGGDVLPHMAGTSLSALLGRASRVRPLVLVFEDLHWADLSSIELLEALASIIREHPVLLLLAFRPRFAATSDRVHELLAARYPDRGDVLELEPLAGDAVRHLINNLFAGAEIPQRVRSRIVEAAMGNPFFVEEIARSLLEGGAVERVADGFRATPRIERAEIPGSVQEVIQARVERLPAGRREVLHLASVLGRRVWVPVLEDLVERPASLTEDLEALADAGFLEERERTAGEELTFRHPLIQEVTYDRQLEERRRGLHLEVARALEAKLPPDRPGFYATLAYHWSRGGDLARAEPALFRAGDEAARSAATNEALEFFREASKLYLSLHPAGGDLARRAQLEKSIALALYNRGQLIEAEVHFDEALRALGERVPRSEPERIARFVPNSVSVLARLYLPGGTRRSATELDREVIGLMMKRAEAQTLGSPTRFLFDSVDTLARLDDVDPRSVPGAGGFYSGTVGIFSYAGLSFSLARRFLERAAPLVREDDLAERIFFGMMNHLHHFLAGDWDERHRIQESLIDEAVGGMHIWPVTNYLGLEAEQRIRTGDFVGAREQMGRIDGIWERFGHDLAKTNHYWLATLLALERRSLGETVEAAGAYFDENPEDLLHILALSSMGQAQALEGALDEARESLERASRIVARARFAPAFHTAAFSTAQLQLELAAAEAGGPAASRRRLRGSARRALASTRRAAYRAPEVYRLVGRAAWLNGRKRRALRWWERGLAAGERLGARPELARTAAELARFIGTDARVGDRDERDWHRVAAREFETLGLDEDLRRLDEGCSP